MNSGAILLADRRLTVAGCVEVLRDLHTVLYQSPSGELSDLAGDLAQLRALCGAQLAAVVAEAETRGVVDASQHASTSGWIGDAAWHSRRESVTLAKTARVLRRPDLAPVADAIRDTDIDPGTAVVLAAEYDKLAPDLKAEARPLVLEQFLTVAADHGPAGVRRLRQEILARYAENDGFEDHQERCRRQIDLTPGKETSPGVWEYEFTTDNEGHAVLEAAIGPLSAPQPDPATGERDPRTAGRRRGEALTEALRRSVTAAQHVPTSPKAVLMLTMTLDQLTQAIHESTDPRRTRRTSDHGDTSDTGGNGGTRGTGDPDNPGGPGTDGPGGGGPGGGPVNAGSVIGSRAAGTLLAPDTVRKLACDAAIIPVVLGGAGEILDQGRQQRLFTPAQIKALTLRDQHCTFDDCTAPANWTDAHHLIHWIDGGPTDLDNAALLCGHHHTIAHRDRLAATLTPHGIQWDRRPGSYRPTRQ